MASAEVTRHELSLGARDSTTGWRIKNYAETTIDGVIRPRGESVYELGVGGIAKHAQNGYFPDVVNEGDLIQDANASYYQLNTAPQQWHLDKFIGYYPCELVYLPNYPEESISVPAATEEDARYRTKVWIDSRVVFTATWACIYAYPNYPLQLEFTGVTAVDTLYAVGQPVTTPLFTYNNYVYAFHEEVPITIAVLQKYSQSNTEKMLWSAEDALRTACRDYPGGSIRTINVIRDRTERLGSSTVVMRECTLNYKRTSEYEPLTPSITWGPSAAPTDTYNFPNVVRVVEPITSNDANILVPGRVGSITQVLGAESSEFTFTCDLDVEPASLTWKRPQTTTPKSDGTNVDVFREIIHDGSIDQAYQTLDMGWGGTMQVRLIRVQPNLVSEGNVVDLTFREYRSTSATGTYKARFGIT